MLRNREFAWAFTGFMAVAGAAAPASAALVADYAFASSGNGNSAPSAIAGVTASPVTINTASGNISGSIGTNPSNAYPDNVLQVQAAGDAASGQSVTKAVDGDAYWSFTIHIDNSMVIDLGSLSFEVARGGSSGRGFVIRSSVTGVTNLGTFDRSFNNETGTLAPVSARPTMTLKTIDLSDAAFKGLTDTSVTFYFYHFAADTNRQFEFDDVRVDAQLVPEPASVALIGVGGALVLLRQRRR